MDKTKLEQIRSLIDGNDSELANAIRAIVSPTREDYILENYFIEPMTGGIWSKFTDKPVGGGVVWTGQGRSPISKKRAKEILLEAG